MKSVSMRPAAELEWRYKSYPAPVGRVGQCRHHEGTASDPEMFEITLEAGGTIPLHAHNAGEIVYVLEGELRLGPNVLPAGSSVFVPEVTLYKLVAGPEGVRFLNFRPCRDDVTLSVEDVKARSKASADASAQQRRSETGPAS